MIDNDTSIQPVARPIRLARPSGGSGTKERFYIRLSLTLKGPHFVSEKGYKTANIASAKAKKLLEGFKNGT